MLVSELIEKLKTVDQTLIVLGRGYETGYDPIEDIDCEMVDLYKEAAWYDGQYRDGSTIPAIILT